MRIVHEDLRRKPSEYVQDGFTLHGASDLIPFFPLKIGTEF